MIRRICLFFLLAVATVCSAQDELPPLLDDEEEKPEELLPDEDFLPDPRPVDESLWNWEPPPEYGPGSFTGTGMHLFDWTVGPLKIALHFGLHPAVKQGLEQLEEAQKDFNYPITRIRLDDVQADPNEELLAPAGLVNELLGLNRFVYVIVTF